MNEKAKGREHRGKGRKYSFLKEKNVDKKCSNIVFCFTHNK